MALAIAAFVVAAFTYRFNHFIELVVASGVDRAALPEQLAVDEFGLTAGVCLLVLFMHERNATQQFILECALQLVAARRIDQLDCEKQRLEFERRMEEVRVVAFEREVERIAGCRQGPDVAEGGTGTDERGATSHAASPAAPHAVSLAAPRAAPHTAVRVDGDETGRDAACSQRLRLASASRRLQSTLLLRGCDGGGSNEGGSTVASCEELREIADLAGVDVSDCARGAPAHESASTARGATYAALRVDSSSVLPAAPPPHTTTRTVEELNWPDRQRLMQGRFRALQSLVRARPTPGAPSSDAGSSDVVSSAHSGGHTSRGYAYASSVANIHSGSYTCPGREAALWRSLRSLHLVNSPTNSNTCPSESAGPDPCATT